MIELKSISKQLGDFFLNNIDITVRNGEYVVVLGPSGSGKTVLLELIAGIEQSDSGTISGVDYGNVGFIYQDLMLFPHLNVFDNIAYGLKIRKYEKSDIRESVENCARQLEILPLLHRSISTLSGGEQQRVAIARALILKPALLLLDEPTAALDQNRKKEIQRLFRTIHREMKASVIHVTHDFNEALAVADKIIVLNNGEVIQEDMPEEIFNHPVNRFVADFVGYQNVYHGNIQNNIFSTDSTQFFVNEPSGKNVYAAIKSEDVIISKRKLESSARNSFSGCIKDIERKVHVVELRIDIGVDLHAQITLKSLQDMDLRFGETVFATFKSSAIKLFTH